MKIIVPVKQAAALDEEFELLDEGARVDPDFLEWDLNEWDKFSLEAALRIRENVDGDGDEVVVATVGPEEAEGPIELSGQGGRPCAADLGRLAWGRPTPWPSRGYSRR